MGIPTTPDPVKLIAGLLAASDTLLAQAGLWVASLERYVLGRPRIMTEMYRGLATPELRSPDNAL